VPRVASETSVSAQVAASQTRAGKQPPRGTPDLFAQLLPNRDRVPAPTERQPAQASKPAEQAEAVTGHTRPQGKPVDSGEANRSESQPAAEADKRESDFAAEVVQAEVAPPQPAPDTTVKLPTAAAITTPAAEISVAPAAAPVAAPATVPGPAPAAEAPALPAVTPTPAQTADPAPVPAPAAPVAPAAAAAPAAQPAATPGLARESAPLSAPPAPATVAAPAIPTAQPGAAEQPAPGPAVLDEPVMAPPPTPVPATAPVPDKPAGVTVTGVESAGEPALMAEGILPVPAKPLAAQIAKAKLVILGTPGAAEPASEGIDEQSAKPAATAATDAKPQERAAAREGVPAPAARINAQTEASPSAANLVNPLPADLPMPDLKILAPLDLATTGIQTAPQQHTASPASPASLPPATVPVPLAGLAVAIAGNAQGGQSRFEIRLDPPELGRIDVRLHFDADGRVTSHLIVDRSETLDLLRRDAADLERSLQQAGLKTSDQGMQFTLRDQAHDGDSSGRGHRTAAHVVVPDNETTTDIVTRGYTRAGEGAGLDIRV
jgi:flagellar hook-length control protein FliK